MNAHAAISRHPHGLSLEVAVYQDMVKSRKLRSFPISTSYALYSSAKEHRITNAHMEKWDHFLGFLNHPSLCLLLRRPLATHDLLTAHVPALSYSHCHVTFFSLLDKTSQYVWIKPWKVTVHFNAHTDVLLQIGKPFFTTVANLHNKCCIIAQYIVWVMHTSRMATCIATKTQTNVIKSHSSPYINKLCCSGHVPHTTGWGWKWHIN